MSIETTLAEVVRNTEQAVTDARQVELANRMMTAICDGGFGSVPLGQTIMIIADLLGRLSVRVGGDDAMATARGLCTLVLMRAQKGRG
jgi:hypothetical protein